MPITYHLPPARIQRAPAQNPAEIFMQTGAVEMGLTEPTYNGTPVTSVNAPAVTSPSVTITRANVVVGGQTYPTSAQVTQMVTHNIAWPMYLPPNPVNGMWTALTKVSGIVMKDRLKAIMTRRRLDGQKIKEQFDPDLNKKLLKAGTNYTFQFKLEPDAATFMRHVENHEFQHVADHKWLAERVIGWWDDWLNEPFQANATVVANGGADGLANGFDYSIGVPRIIMYWCRVANYSGDLYHQTDEGAAPVLNVESVTDNSVTATIRPKTILHERPDVNNPSPHKEMQVKTKNLDGTEVNLGYGSSSNPFTEKSWTKFGNQWVWPR